MWRVRISHLVQGPWPLIALLCVCLLFLYALVQGGQQHRQPGSGELDKLRVEVTGLREKTAKLRDEAAKLREGMSAQNEMIKKLQDQNRDFQSKIDKMQGDLHGCWNASMKHGELVQGLNRSLENYEDQNSNLQEEMSAQNEMIEKLQDQNWDLQSKIDKMQGDLHGCWNASKKYGELVQGFARSLENYEDQNSNLQEEMSAQNETIEKLQDQNRDFQSKIDKMQGDLHGCWNASKKHGELVQGLKRSLENYEDQNSNLQKEMSAQNEINKKLQDQNRDLQSKIDKMQGDLQRCRTESGKHGELVQEMKRHLEYCGNHNSNLRYSLQSCRSQPCKSQDDNIWWFIVTFVLGFFLGCCLGHCSKCMIGRP